MIKFLWLACWFLLFAGARQFQPEKVWLFSKKQYNGNVPVNLAGKHAKGFSTILLCFFEVKKDQPAPVWQEAHFHGQIFKVTEEPANQDSVTVGTIKNTHTMVVIKPRPGYRLLHLSLKEDRADDHVKTDGIVIKGKLGQQDIVFNSKNPVVELESDLMP